ncbi:MAG: WhiB family transcriptional regulator [Candidatus Saccharimonadales bacterium]
MKDIDTGNRNSNFSGICAQTDPELFFPDKGKGTASYAKNVCATSCDTTDREICLEGALERKEPFGVWGGMSKAERDREIGRRAKNAG